MTAANLAPPIETPPQRFVHSGEVLFSKRPAVFTTVLGSCISVCLWDRHNKWGGMNHFVHASSAVNPPRDATYGTIAVADLINRFLVAGSRLSDLNARVVGGGHVLQAVSMRMGDKNIREALEQLAIWSIPIVHRDTGRCLTRRVEFHTATGKVCVEGGFSTGEADFSSPMRILREFQERMRQRAARQAHPKSSQ